MNNYFAKTNLEIDFEYWKKVLTHVSGNVHTFTFKSNGMNNHWLKIYLNEDNREGVTDDDYMLEIYTCIGSDFSLEIWKNDSMLCKIKIKHDCNGKDDNAKFDFVKKVWNGYIKLSHDKDKKLLDSFIDEKPNE